MPPQTLLPDCAIAELFYQVCQSGELTRTHRYGLMSALLECAISEEDQAAIDRVIHAARRGWVTILD